MVWTCAHTLCNNDGPSLGWIMGGGEQYIYIYLYQNYLNQKFLLNAPDSLFHILIPVVPHEAVAEVSRIGNV